MGFLLFYRFRYYLFAILGIVLLGTVGLCALEGYSIIDAFYMTLITISTVGFGEVEPLSPEGRLFVSGMIVTSFVIIGVAAASISSYVLDGYYREDLFKQQKRKILAAMKDHVIVCGYGRVGSQTVERLLKGNHKVVVIEKNISGIIFERRDDLLIIQGDATQDETLAEAGIEKAHTLIAALPSDADNLFVVVSAHTINPSLNIVSRASDRSSMKKIRNAGANHVIMPDTLGGEYLAQLVVQPDLMEFISMISQQADDMVNLEEVGFNSLPDGFHYKTIGQLNSDSLTGCTIIGFRKPSGEIEVNPSPQTEVIPNSKLFVLEIGRASCRERV